MNDNVMPVGGALAGEPVLLVDDSKKGEYYRVENYEALRKTATWSDGLCDCLSAPYTCCCAFLCPCYILFQSLDRVGRVKTPVGVMSKWKFLIIFIFMFLLNGISDRFSPVIYCRKLAPFRRHHHGHYQQSAEGMEMQQPMQQQPMPALAPQAAEGQLPPPAASAAAVPGTKELQDTRRLYVDEQAADAQAEEEEKPKMRCMTVASVLSDLSLWVLLFFAVKGIRDKLNVQESDVMTFLKTACCPDLFLCCQCCYLSQVARHVDRAQGFAPMPGAELQAPPGGSPME
eukprot:TRINITY_DN29913_c0_g1_i1.p2 TRINITY_DN29913_c0_g1~~TRINITY_DN29913_c0_g1_i1.p2  ORF type:complete len:287 (+),score=81.27 TRINITY_DN29913_c0_g1_i1:117-977(+)